MLHQLTTGALVLTGISPLQLLLLMESHTSPGVRALAVRLESVYTTVVRSISSGHAKCGNDQGA
jgi:hypothetical protein